MDNMITVLATSLALKFVVAIAAAFALWWLLRLLDKSLKINFRTDVWPLLKSNPVAAAIYFAARFVGAALVFALVLAACSQAGAAEPTRPRFPAQYDRQIQAAAGHYLPGVPWRLWKAQLYQESRLDPDAVSPAGAVGIAQFMPATWLAVSRQLGYGLIDRRLAAPAIEAGAYYMATLRAVWSSPRPEHDRHSLAMASYNAGTGNMLAAQRACGGALLYDDIMICLPQVTGRYAAETIGYAPAIWRWFALMQLEGG